MNKVFYAKKITPESVAKVFDVVGAETVVKENHLTAIKIHFGEEGNLGYIKPHFVKPVSEKIKSFGAKPFLTDANTIYIGSRSNAIDHTTVALRHGFTVENTGAPVIISDGLRGNAGVEVEVNLKHFKNVSVSNAVHYADSIVFMTHFKGHEITGFGGALKNMGMGCATREGKYRQHNSVAPKLNIDNCCGCGVCVRWCPSGALNLKSDRYISFSEDKCVGCGECILSCPSEVFKIPWNNATSDVQEKMVEYAVGAVRNKGCVYINFLNFITKHCDCWETREKPYFDELGVMASLDPVAIDAASLDMVNIAHGGDFFRYIFPSIDWNVQLDYAREIGLGARKYELVAI